MKKLLSYELSRSVFINGIFYFILLSSFAVNNVYAALSATTAKTVQGSRPFVKLNGTTISGIDKLLSFTLPDGTAVEPTITGPAHVLPTNTFNQVTALITADNSEYSLASMPEISYGDNDIDGPSLTAPITGTLKATWSYKLADGTTKVLTAAELTNTFVACDAPYTLTISANNVKAQSAYGDPIDKDYGSLSKSYTVNVADYKICFAKPNSLAVFGGLTSADSAYPGTGYNANVFVDKQGFLPSAPTKFPTTGFNNAVFTLDMSNAQTDYTYTSSNPAVKISNTQGVVTLTSTTKPTLPLNVTLTATPTDTKYSAVTYSFSITKWARMVGKSIYNTAQDLSGTYTAAIACGAPSTLSGASNRDVAASYFFKRSDITNIPSKSSIAPNIGTTSERFSRDIDGTFLGEWGVLYPSSGANPYPGSGVTTLAVWTSETRTSVNQYMVTLHQGYIGNNDRVDYVQWVVMCNN